MIIICPPCPCPLFFLLVTKETKVIMRVFLRRVMPTQSKRSHQQLHFAGKGDGNTLRVFGWILWLTCGAHVAPFPTCVLRDCLPSWSLRSEYNRLISLFLPFWEWTHWASVKCGTQCVTKFLLTSSKESSNLYSLYCFLPFLQLGIFSLNIFEASRMPAIAQQTLIR